MQSWRPSVWTEGFSTTKKINFLQGKEDTQGNLGVETQNFQGISNCSIVSYKKDHGSGNGGSTSLKTHITH